MRLVKIVPILISCLSFLICANFAQAGLGLSPSKWAEEHGPRGAQIEKTFTFSRSDPEEDLYFQAETEGEIKDWLEIDKGLEFIMPKGEQQFPIKVKINIPAGADYGNYKGGIRFKSETRTKEKTSGAGVILGALIQIDLAVSDEDFLDYDILQITVPATKENELVRISLKIWNRGNIEAKPTKLTMVFWDGYKAEQIEFEEIADFSGIKAVPPFSEGEIEIESSAKLEVGQYWAIIKAYHNDEIIKSEEIIFDVKKDIIFKEENPQETDISSKTVLEIWKNYSSHILIIVIVVIIVIGFLLIIKLWKKTALSDSNKRNKRGGDSDAEFLRKDILIKQDKQKETAKRKMANKPVSLDSLIEDSTKRNK